MRIIAVDHWTRGISNFVRLRPALDSRSAEVTLLHLGSLRGDRVKPEENISGITCLDIKAFPGLALEAIIEHLRPDLILMLNIHTLLERALILTCKRMDIPTVYLQHGIMPDPDVLPFQCETVRTNTPLAEYFRKMPRYWLLFGMYLHARRFRLDMGFWRVVWSQFRRPRLSMFYPHNVAELKPTRSLVFYDRDAAFLHKTHEIAMSDICIVGNPELDAAYERATSPISDTDKRRLRKSVGLAEEGPILFYPDEAFADSHLYGWDERCASERFEELLNTCASAGWQLLIRPRQNAAVEVFKRRIRKHRAAVSRDLSIVDAIDISECVFGTVSSVLENAVVLKRPILVPIWYLNNRAQDSPYLRAEEAASVSSPAELRSALEGLRDSPIGRLTRSTTASRIVSRKRPLACETIAAELASIALRNSRYDTSDV